MKHLALLGLLVTSLTPSFGSVVQKEGSGISTLSIKGTINPGTVLTIKRAATEAEQSNHWLIIELNTPGGLLSSTRDIVSTLLESKVPVVIYVSPSGAQATSAGMIITIAAHHAAMTPGTNIGAAHPVSGTGKDVQGDMKKKVVNDTVAFVKSISNIRKRNTDWIEKGVRDSASIPAEEALKNKVIDGIYTSRAALITGLSKLSLATKDGTQWRLKPNPKQVEITPTFRETFITTLSHPNIAFMLLAAGGLGLYVEMTHPGLIFPGVVGGISLLLALTSLQMLPVRWGALALFFLGFILLIAEMFIPSFGMLGLGGMTGIVLGALYLFDTSQGISGVDTRLLIGVICGILAICLIVLTSLVRLRKTSLKIGSALLVGETAIVKAFDPAKKAGSCFAEGTLWHFSTADGTLQVGDTVCVISQKNLQLVVARPESVTMQA